MPEGTIFCCNWEVNVGGKTLSRAFYVVMAALVICCASVLVLCQAVRAEAATSSSQEQIANLATHQTTYKRNVFQGDLVYHETVMFYTGRTTAKLAYPIDEVVSVRSYNLQRKYKEGRDYSVTSDGCLSIPAGSKIRVCTNTEKMDTYDSHVITSRAKYWEKRQYKFQVCVTYRHTKKWAGTSYKVTSKQSSFPLLVKRLNSGKSVNVMFLGDSITCGFGASGTDKMTWERNGSGLIQQFPAYHLKTAYQSGWESTIGNDTLDGSTPPAWSLPNWSDQVVKGLRSEFGNNKITSSNFAVDGATSELMANDENLNFVFNTRKPDLCIIAFGMNETNLNIEDIRANYVKMISSIKARYPNCAILLVSPFSPNMPTDSFFSSYEKMLSQVAAGYSYTGVAPVYKITKSMMQVKQPCDYTANCANHPNDFAHSIYASVVLDTLPSNPKVIVKKAARYKVTKQATRNKNGEVTYALCTADAQKSSISIPETVTLADGRSYNVTAVGKKAFKNRKNLTTVKLSAKISKLSSKAFYKTPNLAKLVVEGKRLKTPASTKNAFKGSRTEKLKVSFSAIGKVGKKYQKTFAADNLGIDGNVKLVATLKK